MTTSTRASAKGPIGRSQERCQCEPDQKPAESCASDLQTVMADMMESPAPRPMCRAFDPSYRKDGAKGAKDHCTEHRPSLLGRCSERLARRALDRRFA